MKSGQYRVKSKGLIKRKDGVCVCLFRQGALKGELVIEILSRLISLNKIGVSRSAGETRKSPAKLTLIKKRRKGRSNK